MAKWSIQLDGDIYRALEQNPIQSEWNPSKETFLEKTVGGFVILNSPPKNSFKDELSATWSAASLELRNILYDLFYTDKTFKLKTHTGYERNVKIDSYSEEQHAGFKKDGSPVFDIDVTFFVVEDDQL